MRFLRLILLFGVAVAVVALVRDYVSSRTQLEERAVAPPSKIPANLESTSAAWQYRQQSGANDEVLITAETFQQTSNAQKLYLGGVELRIEHADGTTYDLITSPDAEFDPKSGNLYSATEVTLTLGLRIDGAATGKQPTVVRAPEVTFDNNAATCWTDAPVRYEFAAGRGSSTGAFYHSGDGYFQMRSQAYLERDPATPGGAATRVWADELVYMENDQRIDLRGSVRLDQGDAALRGDTAHVFLDNGAVSRIESSAASGQRRSPGRVVEFAAQQLTTQYGPAQLLDWILADGAARIESRTSGGVTASSADQIQLIYSPNEAATDSYLRELQLRGDGHVQFQGDGERADRRTLDAANIALHFAGEDATLERIETHSRGRLTLSPGGEQDTERILDADRITANYTPAGVLRYVRAAGSVQTQNRGQEPILLTHSNDFEAEIDPETGEAQTLHQWSNFRFERGDQTGSATDARFTPTGSTILLTGSARVDGPTGSLEGDRVQLDQASGGTQADGSVRTVFVEADSKDTADGIFAPGDPVYATAEHMTRAGGDGPITFRDNARLWQDSNSVAGATITIRRAERTLEAAGDVRTNLRGDDGPPMAVQSAAMRYAEQERRMDFDGAVLLHRGDLTVRSDRLTSWLVEAGGEAPSTELDRAHAEGSVVITRGNDKAGQRKGFGDTADFDPAKETVLLSGKPAQAIRADGSVTQGERLAYDMGGDKLVVEAGAGGRVRSVRQPRRNP